MADKLTIAIESTPEFEQLMRELVQRTCEQAAIEYSQGFEARIRKIVFDAMRERDLRVAITPGG